MPVVPSSTVPSVAPTGNSGVPYQTAAGATPQAFGSEIGEAEQGLGKAFDQLGGVLSKHALQMQEEVNASAAKDLFLQGDIKVGKLTVDYNQLEGINKVNAYPKYVTDINGVRDEMKALAPNGDVAKRFDQDFARRVGYSIIDGARGSATALRQYNDQSSAAIRSNTLSHIAMNPQDDARFNEETKTGLQTFHDNAEYKGASPEVQQLKDREYLTGAWATRLQSMSKTDPLRARDLLAKNRDSIDGGKALQIEDTINQQIINVDTRIKSDKFIQNDGFVSPELINYVKKFEGYSATPHQDFKQISSGYGTKYDPNDKNFTPDELKAVHEQRLYNELARSANIVDQAFPGLPNGTRNALIDLTYNAGAAWTSQGLGQSIRAGDYTAAQTKLQEYNRAGGEVNPALVTRRAQEADWFGGAPHADDTTTRLAGAMDKAREEAVKVFPNDPANQAKYLDTLQNRLKSDYSVMQQTAHQMQLDIKNTVQKEIISNPEVVDYDHLSETGKAAYDRAPPSLKSVFDNGFKTNATRDVYPTDERQKRFLDTRGLILENPDKGMGLNISELDLTRPQKKSLQELIQNKKDILSRGERASAILLDSQSLLNDAGIFQSKTNTDANSEFSKFKGALDQKVDTFIGKEQRKPSVKEGQEMVSELLKQTVTAPGWFGTSVGQTTQRGYQAEQFKPPSNWQFSPSRKQYRDENGKIYDVNGRPVNE